MSIQKIIIVVSTFSVNLVLNGVVKPIEFGIPCNHESQIQLSADYHNPQNQIIIKAANNTCHNTTYLFDLNSTAVIAGLLNLWQS